MEVNKKEVVPFIGTAKEMKKHINPLYIISDYMTDYDTYIEFKENIYTLIKGSFEVKECRTYPVKFKFYKTDKEIFTLELRHFLINLFMWYPFISISDLEILNKDFIFDCINDVPKIDNYINDKIIETLRNYNVRTTVMNNDIATLLYDLNRINIDFSLIMGLTINTETFMDLYKNNQRYQEIMETKFDESLQPHEIEDLLSMRQKESIDILKSIKDNPLGVILRSGTGIKYKQLTEFTTAIGLKPDIMGKIIPIANDNSVLIGGMNKPSSHYIDAGAARKSLKLKTKLVTLNPFNCGKFSLCFNY